MVDKLEIEAEIKEEVNSPVPPPLEDVKPDSDKAEVVKPEEPEAPVDVTAAHQPKVEDPAPVKPEQQTELVATPPPTPTLVQPPKPKEKKRFSLADYKKRRQQEQASCTKAKEEEKDTPTPPPAPSAQTATKLLPELKPEVKPGVTMLPASLGEIRLPPQGIKLDVAASVGDVSDGGGTPTMDEKVGSTALPHPLPPPSINAIHVLAKFDKLEKAQNEIKKKGNKILQ